jgi:selenocysteine-specific elongation factor
MRSGRRPGKRVPTVVIGTAGHIDHGKTALIRAVTGIDADRLPEERARGMTIDVGYAHLAFEDGVELDFVDVPGHDRLIGNMLVGAGEIDAAMLVVAADDGPRPQTLEHLQLLDALGVDQGLAVVSKADLVDAARIDEVREALRALLAGTSLAEVAIEVVSAATGEGIEALRTRLRVVRDEVGGRLMNSVAAGGRTPPRLSIDRVFGLRGRGVVVTGTQRGAVASGATVRREPGGDIVRIRELQVHGEVRDAHDGGRAAFNVTGNLATPLRRGDVLTDGDGAASVVGISAADRLLVGLRAPASLTAAPTRQATSRTGLRLHVGTAQVDASLRRLRASEGLAVLRLSERLATFPGDRGVLREPASGTVMAGIRVLDPAPPRGASRRRMTPDRLDALAAAVDSDDVPAIERARLELHGGIAGARSRSARPVAFEVADDVRSALHAAALAAVEAHHRDAPLSPGLPSPRARAVLLRQLRSMVTVERQHAGLAAAMIDHTLDELVAEGRLARRGDALRDPSIAGDVPEALGAAMDRLEAALSVPAPPSLEVAAAEVGCPADGVRALQAAGRIVRLGTDLAWSTATYHQLAGVALDQARAGPLSPAAFRDATGTSRKYVLAILEDLDRRGVLTRTPEGHIPGPRAPRQEVAT